MIFDFTQALFRNETFDIGSSGKAGNDFDFENADVKLRITEAISRVYSGVSAILDFEIINFRPYDCSSETKESNCRIVELYLTVDTSRKMQNGVNIDVSIDRLDLLFYCILYAAYMINVPALT